MNIYPIAQVKTADGLWLHGLFIEARDSTTLLLHTHGTASNFYEEQFVEVLAEQLPDQGISVLSVNNRGAGVYDAWQQTGCAVEKFEECAIDLDAWIEFALTKGYKKIILSGHSLGAEKVVYYMNNGKYVENISKLILFGPADSYGDHRLRNGKPNIEAKNRIEKYLTQAKELIANGEGETLLPRDCYGSDEGILPKSANSLVNFLGEGSRVLEALPFHTGALPQYGLIKVPILALIGDQEEYTAIPTLEALALLKSENKNTQFKLIAGANHDFEGKEEEVAQIVLEFINS